MEAIVVLNGREVEDHTPEHLIADLIGRIIPIGDSSFCSFQSKLFGHQSEEEIDIDTLPQEQRQFGLVEGGE